MAAIETRKCVVNPSEPRRMLITPSPDGQVGELVENDGVAHLVVMSPGEAIQKGVALIQAAQDAARMAAQRQQQSPLLVPQG